MINRREYRPLNVIEASTLRKCRTCGACVTYDDRGKHDQFHKLINGIDETVSSMTTEKQDTLPPF